MHSYDGSETDFSLRKLDIFSGSSIYIGGIATIGDTAYCNGLLAIPYTPKPLAVPNLFPLLIYQVVFH